MVVVRVPGHDEISLTTALDAGAAGIVIPHTECAADVRKKIKETFYREFSTAFAQKSPNLAFCHAWYA
jgi:2-keto-3-deoxy-L-rhamnonate aldolase RhmA